MNTFFPCTHRRLSENGLRTKTNRSLGPAALLAGFFLSHGLGIGSPTDQTELMVYIGQSQVVDYTQSIKRVAIANPEVADATVISPYQIMVDGKATGVTSMIVWPESGKYQKYRLTVCAETNPYQVMLQVRFMEVNKNALKELGSDILLKGLRIGSEKVDMGSYGGNVGLPSDPLLLSNTVDMFFAIPARNFSSIIKALQENNLLSVLASPNLSAVSGAEANFLAGGEFPIPIVSGSTGMQTITVQFKEFGVKLKFVPTVLDTNVVHIKVLAEVSNLDFDNGVILSGFRIPAAPRHRRPAFDRVVPNRFENSHTGPHSRPGKDIQQPTLPEQGK